MAPEEPEAPFVDPTADEPWSEELTSPRDPADGATPTPFANADPEILIEIARGRMPFGKYAGLKFIEIPEPYLTWFAQKGWPPGRLGEILANTYEIRINGLEKLVHEIERRMRR